MRALMLSALAVGLAVLAADLIVMAPQAKPAPAPRTPAAAAPGMFYLQGSYQLLLTDRPCPDDEVRDQLEAEGIPPARAYVADQGGKRSRGCWVRDVSGDVTTLNTAGAGGTIPADWLQSGP